MSPKAAAASAIFTEGSTLRHVLVMTGAASIGLMSIFVVDFLSLLYVSRLQDPNLTAAVGFATQVLFFSVSVNIGLAIAIGALVSRAIGAGQRERARRLAASGLVHVAVISVLVGLVGMAFRREILAFLGASGPALDVGSAYLMLTLPATVGLGLGMALAAILRAVGDARRAMYVTLSGAVVTAILDPIFIFALGLGVEGAAIVTVLSRIVFVVVGLRGAVGRHDLVAWPRMSAALADAGILMAIAVPAILTNIAAPVANAYAMSVFSQFGAPVVAAVAIMDRVSPVAFGVLFALSGSVGPILGQNLGAQLYDRLRQTLNGSFGFAALYVLVVAAALTQAAPLLIKLFAAEGETADLLRFFCLYCGGLWFFLGGIFVANASFNNLGFPVLSTVFNWGRATAGTVPFVTLGAAHFGPKGGYVGLIAGAALFGVLAVVVAYFVTARLERRATGV
ncbi:MATE efflux family protein [Methylocella silvestris BL2]|uniref:MATE efflux family protein n=1 Tax=Methylocella silvestris (strain DSM 15510 / CIP 108128 / LMG 27833 / NCIMB 13906 / BL2) TaxID=395965 RepID=B8ELZ5_METSB|nr:MATE family efflux transporter [Methylocella silvestris]ACK50776.1 MATE efflux family protein [Methylocella silvestris BL2]